MGFSLAKHNNLVRNTSNVWQTAENSDFVYSDGETAEKYLRDVLINASDLSSQSLELDQKMFDWATEYHLSSQRANLLRALNLSGIKNALELGCGCGAITRYLGELDIKVDAVEGSPRRAEIAKLRCGDLEDVEVINANFNDLKFPSAGYDAVFLIGVLEYAKRFLPSAADCEDAVVKILSIAKSTLKKDGIVVIASENRMGLKYWMGAAEDHYGQPYIGLYGYPQDRDIKTYDKNEWNDILKRAGLTSFQFCYPFPDYKLPRVMLGKNFVCNDEYAYSLLYRISSRDYSKEWKPDSNEFLIWKSLRQSGYMEEYANSFCIVVSESEERLNNSVPYDFVYFSDLGRKPIYRTITTKPCGKGCITKTRSVPIARNDGNELVKQEFVEKKYISGELLSTLWLNSLLEYNKNLAFENLLRRYCEFLQKKLAKNRKNLYAFDLLPSNIIVDSAGDYQIIDEEWIVSADMSPEYLLFRALVWFGHHNRRVLSRICEIKDITNVKEFIEFGFRVISADLDEQIEEFIELEERVHAEISRYKKPNHIKDILAERISHGEGDLESKRFVAQLFWNGETDAFSEKNSISVSVPFGTERQTLSFRIPPSVHDIRRLRFDPANRPGFFNIFTLCMKYSEPGKPQDELLWQVKGPRDIANCSEMKNIHYCRAALGEVFLSTSDDPQFIFELPEEVRGQSKEGILMLEVEMDWPKSADYLVAMDTFVRRLDRQSQQIATKEKMVEEKETHIRNLEEIVADKERMVEEKETHIRNLEEIVAAKERVVEEKEVELRKQVEEIRAKEKMIAAKDTIIRAQTEEKAYLNSKLTAAKTEISELRNSVTWKLARSVLDPLERISTWTKSSKKGPLDGNQPKQNDNERYPEWVQKFDTLTDEDREAIRKHTERLRYKPLISIVMPQYNCPEKWLRICLDSVCNQLYPHWELCIADDASTDPRCRNVLEEYMKKDKRIKVVFRNKNGHIARATNTALEMVTGEFAALLDHDDKLPEHALYMVAVELNNYPDANLIYTDEDKIDSDEKRYAPCFKSDWNPDLLLSCNYISHLGVYRTSLIKEIGGFRPEYTGAQDYDLVLRFIEKITPDSIRHIPHILYHWRAIPDSVAFREDQKSYPHEAGRSAVQDHLKRRQVNAKAIDAGVAFYHRVVYPLPEKVPMVSIIVPSRCEPQNLSWCVDDILNKTNYPNFEYVLVPNNVKAKSRLEHVEKLKKHKKIRVIPYEKPFNFSDIYNSVVPQTRGEIIGILNDDLVAISDNWLNEMVSHALRPEIGAVGAMLYYPDETIQHAGVFLGVGGVAGHAHKYLPKGSHGYFGRAGLVQNFSAVTAACLVMRRSVFEEVDGFDQKIAVAFGDIDLCMRIIRKGYRILWTPYAEFYHMESVTRGPDDTPVQRSRFKNELEYMQEKWGRKLMWDPFYNPNLTLDNEQLGIAFPPRTVKPWKEDRSNSSATKVFIDSPVNRPASGPFEVKGWVASHSMIKRAWIASYPDIELGLQERFDVMRTHYQYPYVKGFVGQVDANIIANDSLELKFELENGVFAFLHSIVDK